MSKASFPVKPLVLAMAVASTQAYGACQESYLVTNVANSSADPTTLQGAIKAINTECSNVDVTIVIDDSLAGQTISHGEYQYDVFDEERVTITGPSDDPVSIVSGGASDSFFYVQEGGQLTLNNLILDGGQSIASSGIRLYTEDADYPSSLNLNNVTMQGFYATASGAAINSTAANVTINESTFTDNRSNAGGGAISSFVADLTVNSSTFSANTAITDSGNAMGGAIVFGADLGTEELAIAGSRFENNAALNHGGAIWAGSAKNISISDSVFENNSVTARANEAGTGANAEAHGGAISFYQTDILTIEESDFIGNSATNYGGALYIENNKGGISPDDIVDVNITDTTFDSNSAIYSVTEGTLSYGGAIYTSMSSTDVVANINISESTLKNNTAACYAGALYIADSDDNMIVTIDQTTVDNNQTDGTAETCTHGSAGAILIAGDNTLIINRSTLSNNTAASLGGAVYVQSQGGDGTQTVLQMSNATVTGNNASNGAVTISGAYGDGSFIKHSTFIDNTATNGGGAIVTNGASSNEDLIISHTIVSGNESTWGQVCNLAEANHDFVLEHSFLSVDDQTGSCRPLVGGESNLIGAVDNILDPMLNALAVNGSTQSYSPQLNSPVVNAGDASITEQPDTDQTGSVRISRGRIDMGAVEYINQAPVSVSGVTNISINTNDVINEDLSGTFTDGDSDSLTFEASNLPIGFELSDEGILSGSSNVPSSQEVAVVVRDGFELVQESFTLTVLNQAPTAGNLENQTINTLAALSFDTSTAFTDPESGGFVYGASGLPEGISIDSDSGVISGNSVSIGDFEITVSAEDEHGATAQALFTLAILNQAPIASLLEDVTIDVLTDISIDTSSAFSDPEGGLLQFSSSTLPTGLEIDNTSGVISGNSNTSSVTEITVTANDEHGATAQSSFTLTVENAVPPETESNSSSGLGGMGVFFMAGLALFGLGRRRKH